MQSKSLTVKEYLSQVKKGKRKNKYNAKRTQYDGKWYDSKLEAGYAQKLDTLKKAKDPSQRVERIETQVPYKIISKKGNLVFTYLLDFLVHYRDGRIEYIDVKGVLNPMSKMKIKAVEKEYGISIKLVKTI